MKVSDYIAQAIAGMGIEHVFTVSGAGMLSTLDAIRRHPDVTYVCNNHEQACAMAAESYARFRQGFGAALVTFGPGVTNTITGLAGAWMDSTPVLMLSGQVKQRDMRGESGVRQRGIQEIDVLPIVRSLTKFAEVVRSEQEIEPLLRQALRAALADRPGPVWLDIPMDIQERPCPTDAKPITLDQVQPTRLAPAPECIQELVMRLSQSERPLLYLGNGLRIAGGVDLVLPLVEALGIPVVTSWNGADLIPNNHTLFVGRPGIYGQRGANFALQNCDLLLSIGARMSIPQTGYNLKTFARAAYKVMVDIDRAELQKMEGCFQELIEADARAFTEALLAALPAMTFPDITDWKMRCQQWKERYSTILPNYEHEQQSVNSYWFCGWLAEHLPEPANIVTDMGTSFTGTFQALTLKPRHRIATSSGLASMGYGIASAVGAAFASKDTPVICITGDGGIQMNIQELQTIAHYRFPVKIFLLNNHGYLTIRHTQRNMFGVLAASSPDTGVDCPDFEFIAKAYGIRYEKFETSADLPTSTPDWMSTREPVLCEITMPREQLLIPKTGMKKLPDGRIVSPPLEDLFPYLDRTEFAENMLIPPVSNDE
jgi:acetolactate synthase-1/2/3 large subunit